MKFKKMVIKNFRNFQNASIDMDNKNVFFGMNDVGKTNALYAIRYVFDNELRKKGIIESDFFQRNTKDPIEIIISLDISEESEDNNKIRAIMKGNLLSETEIVYIKFMCSYNMESSCGDIMMLWGYDENNLSEMNNRGYSFDLDRIFNVTYIDSYVDMFVLFKKNISSFIVNDEEKDMDNINSINENIKDLNSNISKLSGIKNFECKILPKYEKYRKDELLVSIKSEIAIKGFYSDLVPYLHKKDDLNDYPTSGDGRKKILTYSLYDLINEEKQERKIVLYLIEEPENHLHKSLQISLSKILFSDENYEYVFLTTHSPYIVYEMDNVNLIRICKNNGLSTPSMLYKVPEEFENYKKILNRAISEAIFSSKVLLVEGPSEQLLFEKIFEYKNPNYEEDGVFILPVNGIGFQKYKEIFDRLNIFNAIKTDNDLKKAGNNYILLGFNRCNKLTGENILPNEKLKYSGTQISLKRKIYKQNLSNIDKLQKEYKVFLSEVDLETDLNRILHSKIVLYLGEKNPVKYMQQKKQVRMFELVGKLNNDDCEKIYNSKYFKILKLFI